MDEIQLVKRKLPYFVDYSCLITFTIFWYCCKHYFLTGCASLFYVYQLVLYFPGMIISPRRLWQKNDGEEFENIKLLSTWSRMQWLQFSCWTYNWILILGRVFYSVLCTRHSLFHILSFVHFPVVLDCCRTKNSDKWATKCHRLLIGILIFLFIFIIICVFKPSNFCWICKVTWLPFQCLAVCAFADGLKHCLDLQIAEWNW